MGCLRHGGGAQHTGRFASVVVSAGQHEGSRRVALRVVRALARERSVWRRLDMSVRRLGHLQLASRAAR